MRIADRYPQSSQARCALVMTVFSFCTLIVFASGCVQKTRAPETFTAFPDGEETLVPGDQLVLTRGVATFKFRYCPPGTFTMGSPESESGHEEYEVQIPVRLTKGFWLMETEITEQQWRSIFSLAEDKNVSGSPTTPRGNVRPTELSEFLLAMNDSGLAPDGWIFDVPNSAQWEYACRAGTKGPYNVGSLDEAGWYSGNSDGKIHDVAQKKPNAWGLYDMHGNLWEYSYMIVTKSMKAQHSISSVPTDESLRQSGELDGDVWVDPVFLPASSQSLYGAFPDIHNPMGSGGTPAFMRGGSAEDPADSCRASARTLLFFGNSERYTNVGLRIMLRPKTEEDDAIRRQREKEAAKGNEKKTTAKVNATTDEERNQAAFNQMIENQQSDRMREMQADHEALRNRILAGRNRPGDSVSPGLNDSMGDEFPRFPRDDTANVAPSKQNVVEESDAPLKSTKRFIIR